MNKSFNNVVIDLPERFVGYYLDHRVSIAMDEDGKFEGGVCIYGVIDIPLQLSSSMEEAKLLAIRLIDFNEFHFMNGVQITKDNAFLAIK